VAAHAVEEKRDQIKVELAGQVGINPFERSNVIGSIVAREGHASEEDTNTGSLQGLDHGDLVGAGSRNGQAAKTVVAAEFEDYDDRFGGQDVGQALNSISRSIAADPQVDDVVVVPGAIEEALEIVGIALAGRDAKASGQTVAKGHDRRSWIVWGFR
jgi:hypothetical protein